MLTPYSAVVAYTPIMEMVTAFVRLSVDSVLLLLSVVAIKRTLGLIVTVAVTDGQASKIAIAYLGDRCSVVFTEHLYGPIQLSCGHGPFSVYYITIAYPTT